MKTLDFFEQGLETAHAEFKSRRRTELARQNPEWTTTELDSQALADADRRMKEIVSDMFVRAYTERDFTLEVP